MEYYCVCNNESSLLNHIYNINYIHTYTSISVELRARVYVSVNNLSVIATFKSLDCFVAL